MKPIDKLNMKNIPTGPNDIVNLVVVSSEIISKLNQLISSHNDLMKLCSDLLIITKELAGYHIKEDNNEQNNI